MITYEKIKCNKKDYYQVFEVSSDGTKKIIIDRASSDNADFVLNALTLYRDHLTKDK